MRSTLLLPTLLAILFVSASPTLPLAARQQPKEAFIWGPGFIWQIGDFYRVCCSLDSENDRVLPVLMPLDGPPTVNLCVDKCGAHNFKMAGIENGGASCFCGDDNLKRTYEDTKKCAKPCEGDAGLMCGDYNYMIIYVKT